LPSAARYGHHSVIKTFPSQGLSMNSYTAYFRAAAEVVRTTKQYPGQPVPGLWCFDTTHRWPVLIGVICANALAKTANTHRFSFDSLLDRFAVLTSGVPFDLSGDPARIAVSRLLYAADQNTEATARAHEQLVSLSGHAAAIMHQAFCLLPSGSPIAQEARIVENKLRRVLSDIRIGRETLRA
jgi:hypothetical protein